MAAPLNAVLLVLALSAGALANIRVTDLSTMSDPQADMMSAFMGDDSIAISNMKTAGLMSQFGLFFDGQDTIGLDSGLVLSTGYATSIDHVNGEGSLSGRIRGPGDPDLSAVSNMVTKDAASFEFEFVPVHDRISFSYVFASEEYPEYVGSHFNDIFGLFINGVNCAMLPNGGGIVAINNVNAASNADFYVKNNNKEHLFEFDGFTKVLQCESAVTPGAKNHLKVVIADVEDHSFDSAVFLLQHSFSSEMCFDMIDNDEDGEVDEGCPVPDPETDNMLVRCEQLAGGDKCVKHQVQGACVVAPCTPRWVADLSGSTCCRRMDMSKHWIPCSGHISTLDFGTSICCTEEFSTKLIPTELTDC